MLNYDTEQSGFTIKQNDISSEVKSYERIWLYTTMLLRGISAW